MNFSGSNDDDNPRTLMTLARILDIKPRPKSKMDAVNTLYHFYNIVFLNVCRMSTVLYCAKRVKYMATVLVQHHVCNGAFSPPIARLELPPIPAWRLFLLKKVK